jgi:hypothetical protein
MPKIISVSRRTDIPAFYGNWFMNRISCGYAAYANPFNNQKYEVSLSMDDVLCFVFWSKNFSPFMKHLEKLKKSGYNFYFNYTITGLPSVFEKNVIDTEKALNSLKTLSDIYSPEYINWRYDPIILSNITDYDFHINTFTNLASSLSGYTNRCIISFTDYYNKVKKNLSLLEKDNSIQCIEPDNDFKINLSTHLAKIAKKYDLTLYSCCEDYLVSSVINKAHCVDAHLVNRLFFPEPRLIKLKPTRKECGCFESVDIGAYNTCPHGCVYCYANVNKKVADYHFKNQDIESPILNFKSNKDKTNTG